MTRDADDDNMGYHHDATEPVDEHEDDEPVDEYEDDEDDETIEIFRSEAEAQEMFNEVFKLALDAFSLTVTRQLIFNGCKQNNIDLIEPKARDASSKIGLIKVDDIKLKMT
ncbi:hypothetical protein PS15p_211431 [Mucor circinelloides]